MQFETISDFYDRPESGSSPQGTSSAGLFRRYVFDVEHVQWWVWIVCELSVFLLPILGFFMFGVVVYSSIHKHDGTGEPLTAPEERRSGGRLLLYSIGVPLVGLFAIGFLLGIIFDLLALL